MPKKTERRGPLVSPGTVCYAEKQEKLFWLSSLGQMIQFETIKFCRTFKNYFGQFVWIEKSHYSSRVSLHEAPTKNETLKTIYLVKTMLQGSVWCMCLCLCVFQIIWSESGEMLCIATEESYFILKYSPEAVAKALEDKAAIAEDGIEDAFEVVSEISEVASIYCTFILKLSLTICRSRVQFPPRSLFLSFL